MKIEKIKEWAKDKSNFRLIAGVLAVAILSSSIGLGVVASNDSDTPTEMTDKLPKYEVVDEVDPTNSSKQVKTLKITKTFSESDFPTVKESLESDNVDLSTIEEVQLPFTFRKNTINDLAPALSTSEKEEELYKKIKVGLGFEDTYETSKIGFVLEASEYDISEDYKSVDLVEITLPMETTSIPNFMFKGNKIKKFNLEELSQLTSIGNEAFEDNLLNGDLSLSKLTKLKLIGKDAFSENMFEGKLTLAPNIETIGESAFNKYTDFSSAKRLNKFSGTLKLPSSLKIIEDRAFMNNELTKLDWSGAESLTTIGASSFARNKLSTLDFEDTPPKLAEIKESAFANNSGNLIKKDVTIPFSIKTIGDNAFSVADNVTVKIATNAEGISPTSFSKTDATINIEKSVIRSTNGTHWKIIESGKTLLIKENTTEAQLAETYTEIIDYGINPGTYENLHLPYSLKPVAEDKVKEVLHMETVEADNIGYIFHKSDYNVADSGNGVRDASKWRNEKIIEVNLPESLTAITRDMFENNKIKKVNFDELVNVESIGTDAFWKNSFTDGIDLSKMTKLKEIGAWSFAVSRLTGELKLPPNVEVIEVYAFGLSKEPDDPTAKNKLEGTLVIPASVKRIGEDAFLENDLTKVDFSNARSLETIGETAFKDNKIATSINLNATNSPKLASIGFEAFGGTNGETITSDTTFPYTLTKIGANAFKVKDGVTIKVLNVAEEINAASFSDNTTVIIDKSIESPTEDVNWKIVDSGKTLRVKENTTEAQLATVSSELIERGVDVSTFENLHLPYSLKTVTEDDIKAALKMESFNNDNIGYILHKADYQESIATGGTTSSGGYKNQKLVEVNLPETITSIPRDAFEQNKIKKVNFDELVNLETIGIDAFYKNNFTGGLDLSKLAKLTTIGNFAFAEATLRGELKLPPNITEIKKNAFSYDTSYKNDEHSNRLTGTFVIPASLEKIGDNAFDNNKLTGIDFSNASSLVEIGKEAFANNDRELITEDFTVPVQLITIGDNAIKVKDGITITKTANQTGVNDSSFNGTPKLVFPPA